MYAVSANGKSWRAISTEADAGDGEAVVASLPAAADPVEATRVMMGQWLDRVVQARGYDNIVSCASYATSTNDTFRAEALAAIAWRDAVYAMGYEILAATPDDVKTPDDVMALLPQPQAFGWPE